MTRKVRATGDVQNRPPCKPRRAAAAQKLFGTCILQTWPASARPHCTLTEWQVHRGQKDQSCNQRYPNVACGLPATSRPFAWPGVFSCDRTKALPCRWPQCSAQSTQQCHKTSAPRQTHLPQYPPNQRLTNSKCSLPAFNIHHKSKSQIASKSN